MKKDRLKPMVTACAGIVWIVFIVWVINVFISKEVDKRLAWLIPALVIIIGLSLAYIADVIMFLHKKRTGKDTHRVDQR
jgi:hypothetical protein